MHKYLLSRIYPSNTKKIFKNYIFLFKDFIFHRYICKMYIFAEIKLKLQKIKNYIGTKTTFEFFEYKKIFFFNVKAFIFYKYICKMYLYAVEYKVFKSVTDIQTDIHTYIHTDRQSD